MKKILALLTATALMLAWLPAAAGGESQEKFPEVGRLPVMGAPEIPPSNSFLKGWLILNPATRRGYQVFEAPVFGVGSRTVLQSFDLDTLKPRRRALLAGLPITSGIADVTGVGGTTAGGEIVHAVDQEAGRLYLALSDAGLRNILGVFLASDSQRPLQRVVAIDEEKFDAGAADWAASFREPVTQVNLHDYWVLGMAVSRHHVGKDEAGRLFVLFAHPNPLSGPAFPAPVYDHTLAQWDPRGLEFRNDAPLAGDTPPQTLPIAQAGLARRLDVCSGTSIASAVSSQAGSYQWGLLATRAAVYTACQAKDASGVVARIGLDADGTLTQVGGQTRYPFGRKVSDVLVDEGGERLIVRSPGNGQTWWIFDAALERFTGAIAAKLNEQSLAAGVDPTTGRFYQFMDDYFATASGREIPIRGGFLFSDTRIDPVPPLENARPDLAYPAIYRILIDPPTRRVFLRRAHTFGAAGPTYPGTWPTTPKPPEPFYRVLKDNIPLAVQPEEQDDSIFTTNVKEAPGITQAAYLGSGSAYGTRILLIGGTEAAFDRRFSGSCGNNDREFLIGSVGGATVSDLSREAAAAGLDADARTISDNCFPPAHDYDQWDNQNPQNRTPDGINDYLTTCLNDGSPPTSSPREGFTALVSCNPKTETAQGSATGLFILPGQVKVGYSHSEVTAQRDPLQGGIVVKVSAIARNIEIPGFGVIGLVKAEATSRAEGRLATASTTYKRTVCGVDLGERNFSDCLTEEEQRNLTRQFKERFGGRADIFFRDPDPRYAKGSRSGYQAAILRDRLDRFQDQIIARDNSLVVPAMELVFYNGDSDSGTGRQFFQFAGVEAATTYGISCLYGQNEIGACNTDSFTSAYGDITDSTALDTYAAPSFETFQNTFITEGNSAAGGVITKILQKIQRFGQRVGEGLLLALSSPMQGALVASVWALLYLPHYLGARRRLLPGA